MMVVNASADTGTAACCACGLCGCGSGSCAACCAACCALGTEKSGLQAGAGSRVVGSVVVSATDHCDCLCVFKFGLEVKVVEVGRVTLSFRLCLVVCSIDTE